MKIIFLDVDGVLNGYNKWNTLGFKISKIFHLNKIYKKIVNPFGVHISKVKRLAKIVKHTGAKIVLTSSWRARYWNFATAMNEKNIQYLKYHNKTRYDNDIEKLYILLHAYNIDVIGKTEQYRDDSSRRDIEIYQYLKDYQNKELNIYDPITHYIILDDENSMLPNYINDERFIQTSNVGIGHLITGSDIEDTGLKRKHVRRAIRILNR